MSFRCACLLRVGIWWPNHLSVVICSLCSVRMAVLLLEGVPWLRVAAMVCSRALEAVSTSVWGWCHVCSFCFAAAAAEVLCTLLFVDAEAFHFLSPCCCSPAMRAFFSAAIACSIFGEGFTCCFTLASSWSRSFSFRSMLDAFILLLF